MLRFYTLVFLLHAYLGWRLLPDLPTGAAGAALALWLSPLQTSSRSP